MYKIFFLCIFLFTSARGQGRAEGDSCIDENTNTIGRCTVRELCQSAAKDYFESRIQPTFCSYNTFDDEIICCRDSFNIASPSASQDDRPIWGDAVHVRDRRRVSERKCEVYSRSVVKIKEFMPLIRDAEAYSVVESNCEYTGVELIVGGTNAKLGEFPHMAAIGWTVFDGGYTFACGGALISPRFVLTAAHCNKLPRRVVDPNPAIVRLGEQNMDDNIYDGADPVDVAIRRLHLHPDHKPPLLYNDIALIELLADVKFKSAIRPACLWTKMDLEGYRNVIATGWGSIDDRTQQKSKELQKVSLPILDEAFCNKSLQGFFNRHWNGYADTQMCVGYLRGGRDTCQGDSGGPIQVVSKENSCVYYVVGVTAFGKDCARLNRPAVYTRVSSFIDWIENIVWPGE